MLFPTVTFAVFFLIVLPVSWSLMRHQRAWRPFILLASFVFYGWWDWRFVFLLAASIVVNQVLAVAIHRAEPVPVRKALLALAVAFDLGILAYFKYANFFLSSVDNVLGTSWLTNVTLPVGVSFYTFMAISYVVDTYRRELVPAPPMRFAVFQAFFPHLVAGPIVRASELLPQLESPRDPRRVDTSRAFFLIVSGLFLKVVIANHLATHVVDDVFAAPNRHSSLEVLVGVYGYAVQIFADFCGYTNIAIGVALLLGFEFPQNFASPYTAVSLQDFWRRWHMTLSRWLRDYLYIPLGGNRKGRLLTYRNLLLTMLLGGLWHGAAWTFVVWGGIHGLGLAVERATGWRPHTRAQQWLGRLVTFHVVCLGWIFFRADSFSRAGDVIARLFDAWGRPSPLVTTSVVLAILVGIAGQYVRPTALTRLLAGFQRLSVVAQAASVAVALTLINTLGPTGVAPFIYFRF
ncbi:MAG TPA: MBOAT family protein [Gaiellaceae bacterium]|nr:MBOAT family protein [Gaiellaceae bacterium]